MPVAPSPSTNALTRALTRFSVYTPAPLTAMPAVPPMAAATEPAITIALIVCASVAVAVRLPACALIEERRT